MIDREKVIKGLECCRNGLCFACPYNDGIDKSTDCKQRWADDALALLKAQEPVKPVMCTAHAQGANDVWYECGGCHAFLGINRKGLLIKCPKCGKAVIWDG